MYNLFSVSYSSLLLMASHCGIQGEIPAPSSCVPHLQLGRSHMAGPAPAGVVTHREQRRQPNDKLMHNGVRWLVPIARGAFVWS